MLKQKWYSFQIRYHELLLEGCLDAAIRGKILSKINKYSFLMAK